METAEIAKNSLPMILGAGVVGFALIGAAGWVIRRFWRNAAAAALLPAGVWAMVQVLGAAADPRQMDYALISVLMGIIWWQLFDRANARQDAKRRREEEEQRAQDARQRPRY